MGKASREITDTELSLLNELWQRPSATVPELTEALYGNTQPALLATVRKLLDRLEAKGCVSRDRSRWPHHYSAAVRREELAGNRLQAALTHLIRSERLTAKDRKNLRQLLDELDGKGSGKSK